MNINVNAMLQELAIYEKRDRESLEALKRTRESRYKEYLAVLDEQIKTLEEIMSNRRQAVKDTAREELPTDFKNAVLSFRHVPVLVYDNDAAIDYCQEHSWEHCLKVDLRQKEFKKELENRTELPGFVSQETRVDVVLATNLDVLVPADRK